MAVTEVSPPRSAGNRRPIMWYRSWKLYCGLLAVLVVYGYGWRVTQIRLGELVRGAHLISPFVVALASPDVMTRDQQIQKGATPFYYGGEPPPPVPPGGPRLSLSRVTGAIGDRVTATGEGFAPH